MPAGKITHLTAKQRKFVEHYTGNATEAAIMAGYNPRTARQQASVLIRHPKVIAAIQAREQQETSNIIATRQDRQKFWSDTMLDINSDMRDRLKASELLGKSNADFTENVNLRVDVVEKLKKMSDEEIAERLAALEAGQSCG